MAYPVLPVESPGEGASAKQMATDARNTRMAARKLASENQMRTEWGTGYDANMELSKQGMEANFGGQLRELLELGSLRDQA